MLTRTIDAVAETEVVAVILAASATAATPTVTKGLGYGSRIAWASDNVISETGDC